MLHISRRIWLHYRNWYLKILPVVVFYHIFLKNILIMPFNVSVHTAKPAPHCLRADPFLPLGIMFCFVLFLWGGGGFVIDVGDWGMRSYHWVLIISKPLHPSGERGRRLPDAAVIVMDDPSRPPAEAFHLTKHQLTPTDRLENKKQGSNIRWWDGQSFQATSRSLSSYQTPADPYR